MHTEGKAFIISPFLLAMIRIINASYNIQDNMYVDKLQFQEGNGVFPRFGIPWKYNRNSKNPRSTMYNKLYHAHGVGITYLIAQKNVMDNNE